MFALFFGRRAVKSGKREGLQIMVEHFLGASAAIFPDRVTPFQIECVHVGEPS